MTMPTMQSYQIQYKYIIKFKKIVEIDHIICGVYKIRIEKFEN